MKKYKLLLLLLFSSSISLRAQIITTVAGCTNSNLNGDGGPANLAEIIPAAICCDNFGNIYFSDDGNNQIRKINSLGIISTVAGNGTSGYSGDGGPAISAEMWSPQGLCVDKSGNLYFADFYNNVIRKVSTSGIITTVVGTSASLSLPTAVAIDEAGNLYIADWNNCRVRKADTLGVVTCMAGDGKSGNSGDGGLATKSELSYPLSLAIDKFHNLFIVDEGNAKIRVINSKGIISTYAGGKFGYSGDGGLATAAKMNPFALCLGDSGKLFIVDGNTIRMVNSSGIINTVAGKDSVGFAGDGGLATEALFNGPWAVTCDSAGNIFVADEFNYRLRKIENSGVISTICGNGSWGYSGDKGLATSAELHNPSSVLFDSDGNMFIADQENNRIRKVSPSGIITTIAGTGTAAFSGDGFPAVSADLNGPYAMAFSPSGELYFSDLRNQVVRKIDKSGIITTVAGIAGYIGGSNDGIQATTSYLQNPMGICFDKTGNLYIANSYMIKKVDTAGIITTLPGYGLLGNDLEGLAIDKSGNLYVCDLFENVIRKIDTTGVITTVAGNGVHGYGGDGGLAINAWVSQPLGIAVDSSGNLFISEACLGSYIRMVNSSSGIISTIAGKGVTGYNGDSIPALSAELSFPNGITINDGAIYFADYNNNRVRRITYPLTSGVNSILEVNEPVNVFPSLTANQITISSFNSSILSVKIFNDVDELMIEKSFTQDALSQEFDLSSLTNGIYFVKVTTAHQTTSKRVIVQKGN